jgi:hypothetical protein
VTIFVRQSVVVNWEHEMRAANFDTAIIATAKRAFDFCNTASESERNN